MSRILLFVLVLFTATEIQAQRGPDGANSAKAYGGPPIGKLTGRVIDSLTNEPMPYSTVAVHLMSNDSLVGGGITDDKGKLYIEDLRPGRFKVRINFLGYKSTERNIRITPGGGEIADLGIVYLFADAQNLKSVEITAERSYMQVGIDRKVYTISKDLSAAGGGAIEAMRNIPSIEVDIDGNIALRGSGNVNVLIDGKPSVLTGLDLAGYLETLPASSLESVEVITNPSARFDPDGTAGLINIILKKNRKKGLSGGLSAGLGTRDKYSGSANINYRTSKMNLYGNYGIRDTRSIGSRNLTREATIFGTSIGDSLISLSQDYNSKNNSLSHNVKMGVDWYLSPKTTLSASGNYSNRFRGGGGLSRFEYFDQEGIIESLEFQDEIDRNESSNWSSSLRLDKTFSSRDQNLFLDLAYMQGDRYDKEINYFRDANLDGSNGSGADIIRVLTENRFSRSYVIETGYVHPHMVSVGNKKQEKWRVETGLKAILQSSETDFVSASTDTLSATIINEEGVSNIFKLTSNILSAYGTYRQRWGVWGAQLGLRAEAALTNPELITTGEVFDNDYFSLFPTVHLSRKLDKEQELQVSYSRRINRAQHWALNPFIDRSNPLDIRIGNPDLQPEFIHKVEAGYVKTWEAGHTLTSSVYFTHTDDLITSFRTVNSEGITETTYQNFSWRRRVGLELISSLQFTDWWRGVISADFRRASVDASNIEVGLTNSNFEYAAKATTSITMPWDMMMQVSSNYRGPRVGPQGTFKGFITLDVSVRKDLWNNKASITLRASDLFDQRRFGMITDIPGLYQDAEFKRESRIGWLTFSYKFGKQQFDRKRGGRSGGGFEEGGGDEM